MAANIFSSFNKKQMENHLNKFVKGNSNIELKACASFVYNRIFNTKIEEKSVIEEERNRLLGSADLDLFFFVNSGKMKIPNTECFYEGEFFYGMSTERLEKIREIFSSLSDCQKFYFLDAILCQKEYKFQKPIDRNIEGVFLYLKERCSNILARNGEYIAMRDFYRDLAQKEIFDYEKELDEGKQKDLKELIAKIIVPDGKYRDNFYYDLTFNQLYNIFKRKNFEKLPNLAKFAICDSMFSQ